MDQLEQLSTEDKNRLYDFIKRHDLDYTPVDNIIKFSLLSYDGLTFFIHTHKEEYVLIKYDKTKDIDGKPQSMPYEYYHYKNLQQVLEQLKVYDESIHKEFWYPTANSIEIGFDKGSYVDDWYVDFKKEEEFWKLKNDGDYDYICYNNNNYKPEIKSPFNTLHEVSPINDISFTTVDTLYFEIHPISCQDGSESYLLKLQCNNEVILKEFINYIVSKKKGLRLLLNDIFNEMEKFRK